MASFILSTELPESNQTGHRVYNASKSTTSKILSGYDWNITYGDGSNAKGIVYTDQVTVGATTVATQSVELAESVSDRFQEDMNSDGVFGLGFDSGNEGKKHGFLSATNLLECRCKTAD